MIAGMKTFLIISLLVIAALGYLGINYHNATDANVTLYAAPGNSAVSMFSSMTASAEMVRSFPDGYACTKLDGPWKTSDSGVSMSFYKLSCGGQSGWVNAKWVRL